MKRTGLLLPAALACAGTAFGQCAEPASITAIEYDGKTYELVAETKTWADAAACAAERGGYLVEIGSSEENDRMMDLIFEDGGVSATYIEVFNGGGIAYVWTGGTDQAEEGTWLWDGNNDGDGDHFWTGEGSYGIGGGSAEEGAYVNWGGSSAGTVQEPDNFGATGQNALALGLAGWPAGTTALGIAGEWNDLALNSAIYYIIEYNGIRTGGTEPRTTDGIDPIRIYPNPSTGIVQVRSSGFRAVALLDLQGKLLEESTLPRMNLSKRPQGVYILRVDAGGQTVHTKLMLH